MPLFNRHINNKQTIEVPRNALFILATLAYLLIAITAILAFFMIYPVSWDSPGVLGAVALAFPLHLLLLCILTTVLAKYANRYHFSLLEMTYKGLTLAIILMALLPCIVLWLHARELNVSVSLLDYIANSIHLNAGDPKPENSVIYGVAKDGSKLELDVWSTGLPNMGVPLRPAIVMVHGGGWTHGNRSQIPDWNIWLNSLGYEVFDVEYSMPPPPGWKDEVADIKCAVGWLATNASKYHIDPSRISIMGNSAGGNLAMLAAYSMGNPDLPPSCNVQPVVIRSVINLYGPSDLASGYYDCKSLNYCQSSLNQYIGGSPSEFPDRYRILSPINYIRSRIPPTLTILGTSDRIVPVNQAVNLDKALAKFNAQHETYLLPATDHAFDMNWGGFSTQIARAKIQAFLDQYAD